MMPGVPARRAHTEAEIDAAVQVLSDPARLEEAQRVIAAAAPALQAILEQALEAAEWFGSAHRAQVLEATGLEDTTERLDAVQRLIAEETTDDMAVDIRFLGQSCFELKAGGATVLTDPFLTGNPKGAASADELEPDVILLTHGHADHLGDTVDIAKRTGATVLAIV